MPKLKAADKDNQAQKKQQSAPEQIQVETSPQSLLTGHARPPAETPNHNTMLPLRRVQVLQLQRTHGNAYVRRYLAAQHSSSSSPQRSAAPARDQPNFEMPGAEASELPSAGPPTMSPVPPPPPNDGASDGTSHGAPTAVIGATIQRQDQESGDRPTEEQKAAALAAARAARQSASTAAAEANQKIAKSKGEKAAEKAAGKKAAQAAKQKKAQGKTGAKVKKAPGKKPLDEGTAVKRLPATPAADGQAIGGGAGTNGAGPDYEAPASAEDDLAFQAVKNKVKHVAGQEKTHAPAKDKAREAQAAAESPASEITSKAQANQVGEMEQVETPGFDAAAFKAQLMQRIQEMAPKTAQEADDFKESNKLAGIKGEMSGKVAQEKEASTKPMEEAATKSPDTSAIEPKPVAPLSPAEPGPEPPSADAAKAVPKSKGHKEVEAPLKKESKKVDQQMAEAGVTEEQLAKSNEPEFISALDAKKEAQAHAKEAPVEYRQFEREQLAKAGDEAATKVQETTQDMHGDRTGLLAQIEEQQGRAKGEDEQDRQKVASKIQQIYGETKSKVEKILSKLDGDVEKTFDEGAADAKKAFEEFVDAKMEAYKQERYGGLLGWTKWIADKVAGMPSEVNAFYQQGRSLFLQKMDAVIDNVVAIIGRGLAEAKAEIAKGKQEIQTYVDGLPENLQEVGQQAAQDIQGKFEELEQSIDDKQSELIDTLANKYQENLQAVDSRIEEMKAANQGLVQKAFDAVAGAIETILKLKDMLLGVLSQAAGAIEKIIKDPIGFLGNLISGVKQGLQSFVSNIGTHLKKGLMSWLFGAVAKTGIQLPKSFDLKGILSLAMQVLGITWENLRARAVKLFGEQVVGRLEQAFEIFMIIKQQGLGGLWEFIKDKLANLKEMVIDSIKDMVITQVIKAGIQWLIGILGGPAGAFIKAAKAIYDIIMWFVNNGARVMSLVQSILSSITAIASGAVSTAAKFIEQSLAKAIPTVIGFLASLLGLGDLGQKVRGIIEKIQAPINRAIDWVLGKAKAFVKKIGRALGFGKEEEKSEAVKEEEEKDAERPEVKEGLQTLEAEENKRASDGSIGQDDARQIAQTVKQRHPIFQSITPIEGNQSWDYDYTVQAKRKKGKKPKEGTKLRRQFLGSTPGKDSATGQAVIERMRKKRQIKEIDGKTMVYHRETRQWYPIEECDMGHVRDAVKYWNKYGYKHGERSEQVRKWMTDPNNYKLEPRSINRSRGARLKSRYRKPA